MPCLYLSSFGDCCRQLQQFLVAESWSLGVFTCATLLALRLLECSDVVLQASFAGVGCFLYLSALQPDMLFRYLPAPASTKRDDELIVQKGGITQAMANKAARRARFYKTIAKIRTSPKYSCPRQTTHFTFNGDATDPVKEVFVFPSTAKAEGEKPTELDTKSAQNKIGFSDTMDEIESPMKDLPNFNRQEHQDALKPTDGAGQTGIPGGVLKTPAGFALSNHAFAPPGLSFDDPPILDVMNVGSKDHALGKCKPCAFFHWKGCESGGNCVFCHLCLKGERKSRRKENNDQLRERKIHERWVAEQAKRQRGCDVHDLRIPLVPGAVAKPKFPLVSI